MMGLLFAAVVSALVFVGKVYWYCALFYFPWRTYAAAETRIRRAYRARRESVNR